LPRFETFLCLVDWLKPVIQVTHSSIILSPLFPSQEYTSMQLSISECFQKPCLRKQPQTEDFSLHKNHNPCFLSVSSQPDCIYSHRHSSIKHCLPQLLCKSSSENVYMCSFSLSLEMYNLARKIMQKSMHEFIVSKI
jgi:hypothetical protein